MVRFTAEVVAVPEALMARRLNPERVRVRKVLAVAAEVLGIAGPQDSDAEPRS